PPPSGSSPSHGGRRIRSSCCRARSRRRRGQAAPFAARSRSRVARRRISSLFLFSFSRFHLVRWPVVGFLCRVAAPAIECVVEQHACAQLFEVVVIHPRQAERS